jgi:murein DD-endopeptidase MepM/ murein hydrolase activator NlpD
VPSHIRSVPRIAAALAAAAGMAGATAALAADTPGSGHAARAATAQATAYARDEGDGNPRGFVTVSGDGSRRARGTTVSASTAGAKGTAAATARVSQVSLLDDMVNADLASVRATASGSGATETGSVKNLIVAGDPKGSPNTRAEYDLQGYGKLTVLDDTGRGIVALKVKLTRAYGTYPAGTILRVAYAAASARDGTAPAPNPQPKPPKPPKPKPAKPSPTPTPSKPGKHEPARRKPPRTRTLATTKGFVFPVYGKHSFTNDWHAPRQDTGIHEGNDIFAEAGTPAVSVCDGTLHRVGTKPIPGNRLWVKCKSGDAFFYGHLSAFASDAHSGLDVKAGQVVGFVGSTGDAEQTPPHVHFEVHPGDGDAVNPYPFLRAWESRRDVPAAAWVRENGQVGQQPGTLVVVKDFLSR